MRAGIALGSNLGDRLLHLRQARDEIRLRASPVPILQSSIYETAPVNAEPGAGKFYNAVVEIEFARSAEDLLSQLQQIEASLGRPTDHPRNISRTIDLDLLYFGEEQRQGPALELPHPRFSDRLFVLRPLAEIRPQLRIPGQTATVRELLARLPPDPAIRCVSKDW